VGVQVVGGHQEVVAPQLLQITGFIETSLIDWDGYISAVVFLGRCNFECPFCHDHEILNGKGPTVPREIVEESLVSMKGWVDGVVVSGGEPTSNAGIADLLETLKALGLKVKLDTNGSRPRVLRELVGQDLVDYVAMDIKTSLSTEPVDSIGTKKYDLAAGLSVDLGAIDQSIEFLLGDAVDYEFRTTVVPTIVGRNDVTDISRRIAGAKRYFLQPFEPSNARSPLLRKVQSYAPTEMNEMLAGVRRFVPEASIRGKMKSAG